MTSSTVPMPRHVALLSSRREAALGLRAQLRAVLVAWMFGSFWLWTISGATMTQFARALGTPDWGFGILAALPFVGTVAQLPMAVWLQRYGGRRKWFLIGASILICETIIRSCAISISDGDEGTEIVATLIGLPGMRAVGGVQAVRTASVIPSKEGAVVCETIGPINDIVSPDWVLRL